MSEGEKKGNGKTIPLQFVLSPWSSLSLSLSRQDATLELRVKTVKYFKGIMKVRGERERGKRGNGEGESG